MSPDFDCWINQSLIATNTSTRTLELQTKVKRCEDFTITEKAPTKQRWSNIFGFDSDLNLFPRISNIQIRIRQFLSPNIIRIFESFSSNLEYFKHRFPLNLNLNWEFLGALATFWSHLWAPIDKTCAWMWPSLLLLKKYSSNALKWHKKCF